MSTGARVSRTGFNVNTASDKQMAFSSDWPLLPIEAEGDITITPAVGGEYLTADIFTHNLGYAPVFLVDRVSGNDFFFPLWVKCNSTKMWFDGYLATAITLRWRVFRRPIDTNYDSPIFSSQDATKDKDDDYGLLVSLPGKKVSSTDKRDFSIRSDVRQLMVAKSGYIPAGVGGLEVTHNLGYKPMYLCYVGTFDDDGVPVPNTYRLGSEADDLALTATTTTFKMVLYGYPWPAMAYILFKDTLTDNG